MKLDRRDMLAGLTCIGALGTAEWLRPREQVVLMPKDGKLADIVPARAGAWVQGPEGDIVVPRTEGSLSSRLYGDLLARIYYQQGRRVTPMMLSIAYGFKQSDALQLHRPEACYPAVGFTVSGVRPFELDLGDRRVPAVALTARIQDRIEDVVYWTRMGKDFPRNDAEQRRMRFNHAIDGIVPDGALVRASGLRSEPQVPVFGEVEGFLRALSGALGADGRRVLLAST